MTGESTQASLRKQLYANRAVYFIGGFGTASWAPLVPFLKLRLAVEADVLGLLLLCIGIGSFLTMPFCGALAAKFGCRRILRNVGGLFAVFLIVLSTISSKGVAIVAMLCFGAAVGTFSTTTNIHAIALEKASGRRLMSNMNAFWSIGGFVGAGLSSIILGTGAAPLLSTICSAFVIVSLLFIFSGNLSGSSTALGRSPLISIPRGIVIWVSIVLFIAYLVEGAMMDWSGVFLTTERQFDLSLAGTGFATFAMAMLIMRLIGDNLVQKFGSKRIMICSSMVSVSGFLLVIFASVSVLVYSGFFLIGIGCANIVPMFFTVLGRQRIMSISAAVSAGGTFGYMGSLAGPAVIGLIAHQTSLYFSFGLLAGLIVLQFLIALHVFRRLSRS